MIKSIIISVLRIVGRITVLCYPLSVSRLVSRTLDYIYSFRVSRFLHSGKRLYVHRYAFIWNGKNIFLGNNCIVFNNVILASHPSGSNDAIIKIGDGCVLGESSHITCSNRISIGNNLLTGRRVTITDNSHGKIEKKELNIHPDMRDLYSKGEVRIGDNVWIGDNVIILPNVTIGDGCVIGANSVVTSNIPPSCVAAGNPAKVVREIIW